MFKNQSSLKSFAQTIHLKFREQSRQEVKGKETQFLKIPFKTCNARMEAKNLCSSNDPFPCSSSLNESAKDSPLLET